MSFKELMFPDINKIVDETKNLFLKKNYTFFEEGKYNLNIFGIRNNENIDSFNDKVCLLFKDDNLKWKYFWYDATTDPGLYYLQNYEKSNPKGCAILKEGQYKNAYIYGYHKGKRALQQSGNLTIYRDRNKNNLLDYTNEEIVNNIGLNIHSTKDIFHLSVGQWSAGCQVIVNELNFKHFLSIIEQSLKYYKNSFTYTLFNINDLT